MKKKKEGISLWSARSLGSYIELFERYGLDELCIEDKGFELVLKRAGIGVGLGGGVGVGGSVKGVDVGAEQVGEGVGEGVDVSVEDIDSEWVEEAGGERAEEMGGEEMGGEEMGGEVGQGEAGQGYTIVSSPIVGTFYRKASPESRAFVVEGSVVSPESTIGIVEAMKMMNEIKAECIGRVVKILAEDGSLLEKGQAILYINPNI